MTRRIFNATKAQQIGLVHPVSGLKEKRLKARPTTATQIGKFLEPQTLPPTPNSSLTSPV